MAGAHENGVTLQNGSLPTDSVSFGRFELEQLPWERRSSFTHNRYLEEAEKYATPGSVSKKKEYFEAHFKKKALLHQASEEDQNVSETVESACGDKYRHMADCTCQSSTGLVELSFCDEQAAGVTDQCETIEHEKEKSSLAELPLEIRSLISEIDKEHVNETSSSDDTSESKYSHKGGEQGDYNTRGIVEGSKSNAYKKQIAENTDASFKITNSVMQEVSMQLKAQDVSTKISDAVDNKSGNLKMPAYLHSQQMFSKASGSRHSIASEKTMSEKVDKKVRRRAKLEKQTPKLSLVPSTENRNIKLMISGNIPAKPRSEHNSDQGLRAKVSEVIPHKAVGKSGNIVRESVNRVKFIAKAEIKPTSNVFNFKSSQRAVKRKEFDLKLKEKLHAKEAETSEMQTRSEVVRHAEIKLLRKSLNFKATPMPSFYHETASRVSEGKKVAAAPAKCTNARSKCPTPGRKQTLVRPQAASSRSNQESNSVCEPSPAQDSRVVVVGSDAAERNSRAEGNNVSSQQSRKLEDAKGEVKSRHSALQNQGNGIEKEAERRVRRSRAVSNVKGIVSGRVAVHVAS